MVASAAAVSHSLSRLKRRSQCNQLMERSTTQRVGTGVKSPLPVSPGAVSSRQPQWSRVHWASYWPS